MKKKGIIVATIVMVLVLAVSLTTATYAWFTATSEVTVDSIAFNVSTAADLLIGLQKNNSLTATSTAADYYSGATTYTKGGTFDLPGTWDGDFNSLGSNIDLNSLSFANIAKAVGTGVFVGTPGVVGTDGSYTPGKAESGSSADSAWNDEHYATGMIQANGQGASVDAESIDTAWKNVHYLDVVIGVQATNSNLDSMTCYVTINPTEGNAIIGMNAAINVAYKVVKPGDAVPTQFSYADIYGTANKYSTTPDKVVNTVYNTAKAAYDATLESGSTSTGLTCLGGAAAQTLNPGAMTYAIEIENVESGTISLENIYQVQLVIFIAGYDSDCLEGAKGVGSNIIITFAGVEVAA